MTEHVLSSALRGPPEIHFFFQAGGSRPNRFKRPNRYIKFYKPKRPKRPKRPKGSNRPKSIIVSSSIIINNIISITTPLKKINFGEGPESSLDRLPSAGPFNPISS